MPFDSRVSGQRNALRNIRTVELLVELGVLDAEREHALTMLTRPGPLRTSGAPAPNRDPEGAAAFALEVISALAEVLAAQQKRIEELEASVQKPGSTTKK
jgi:hypothetical protein